MNIHTIALSNTFQRDIQAVDRGCRAVDTLYNITARIPQLVQQSHLENNEGEIECHLMVLTSF